ncbi:MAG TPA: anti-sigma factor [Thermoanaerobaculia bacterium]|nr:anti-sigma factor [Thermoanaerobaculia bacterium]
MTHEEFESIAALDAIGAASAEETRTLNEHLASCNSCRRARDEYAEAATLLARELPPVAPPPEVREHVVETIADEDAEEERARFSNRWWLAIAATLFLALWGWREFGIRVARENVRSQQAQIERLKSENALLHEQKEKLSVEMSSLAAPETREIALAGQQISPTASARVFLEPGRRRAIVFFQSLPSNPKDKSYQLWIIRADQPRPQSAGVFDVSDAGNAQIVIENLPLATEMKALAVTLEPKGGVEQPTNTNFYLMGNS